MDNQIFEGINLPLSLWGAALVASLVVLMVAMLLRKQNTINICICFLTWMTLSFFFPTLAERKNVLKNTWLSIMLMLISPAAIATYYFIGTDFLGIWTSRTCRLYKMTFISKEDILNITELSSFPDFEYESNSCEIMSGIHTVRFEFIDEPPESFFNEIDSLLNDEDNVYWSKNDSYFSFSGSRRIPDYMYTYNRGWDGKYMKFPLEHMSEDVALSIFIGDKGFVCRYYEYTNVPLDMLGNRDSISILSGVQFPAYENKNCCNYEVGPDYEEEWTILLEQKPSKKFIQQIKQSPNWTPLENNPGYYEFSHEIPMKSYEKIVVNENSRVVKAVHDTY